MSNIINIWCEETLIEDQIKIQVEGDKASSLLYMSLADLAYNNS